MPKKWYNYIVSVEGEAGQQPESSGVPATPKSAAQSVAEIAAAMAPEPKFTTPVSDPTSFEEIYKAAEIPAAPKDYSILKVSQMLESDRIRSRLSMFPLFATSPLSSSTSVASLPARRAFAAKAKRL